MSENPEQSGVPKGLKGRRPSEDELDWRRHTREDLQKVPERLEQTAKFLVGIIGICLTIFLTKRPEGLGTATPALFWWASACWLLAAIVSMGVMFPRRYTYWEDDLDSIMETHRKIRNWKWALLLASAFLFFGGLVCAVVASVA